MWILIDSYMHGTFYGISRLNSLNNSWDIVISVGWTERPSHHDIKYMNSQKSHLTANFLIFLYLLEINLISPMAKCPNKGKTNILYHVFLSKKILKKKTFVPKIPGTHSMHNFRHMTIFPKAHGILYVFFGEH